MAEVSVGVNVSDLRILTNNIEKTDFVKDFSVIGNSDFKPS